MKKFEYRRERELHINDINKLGKQGWELIAIVKGQSVTWDGFTVDCFRYYFKRELIK